MKTGKLMYLKTPIYNITRKELLAGTNGTPLLLRGVKKHAHNRFRKRRKSALRKSARRKKMRSLQK